MSQSFAFEVQEVGDADSPGRTLAAAAMEYAYDKERNREKYQKLIELAGARVRTSWCFLSKACKATYGRMTSPGS